MLAGLSVLVSIDNRTIDRNQQKQVGTMVEQTTESNQIKFKSILIKIKVKNSIVNLSINQSSCLIYLFFIVVVVVAIADHKKDRRRYLPLELKNMR